MKPLLIFRWGTLHSLNGNLKHSVNWWNLFSYYKMCSLLLVRYLFNYLLLSTQITFLFLMQTFISFLWSMQSYFAQTWLLKEKVRRRTLKKLMLYPHRLYSNCYYFSVSFFSLFTLCLTIRFLVHTRHIFLQTYSCHFTCI